MREAPVGLIGAFAASRPYLSVGVLAAAATALALTGARHSGEGAVITNFAAAAIYMVAMPLALAGFTPKRWLWKLIFIAGVAIAAGLVAGAERGLLAVAQQGWLKTPPLAMTAAAFGLYLFFVVQAPLLRNVTRLSITAAFAAVMGAAGGAGFLALEGLINDPAAGLSAGMAVAIGIGAGGNVAADFAKIFAAGAKTHRAASAAGHGAVAPSIFALLSAIIGMTIYSFQINFGAVDWSIILSCAVIVAASIACALFAVSGGLALSRHTEQVAVDENRRRRWFAERWQPIRLVLPPATASAILSVFGVFIVIALFEVGLTDPLGLIAFVLLTWAAAAVAFVSMRTSTLISLLLVGGAILAEYALRIIGGAAPAPGERFAALALTAATLGGLTVSWRDAGEKWRNARDIVEHALNDGLRRFTFMIGAGTASLFVAGLSFDWPGAATIIQLYIATSLFALLAAPAAMTVMSARLRY